jgi:putative flippase GtrA
MNGKHFFSYVWIGLCAGVIDIALFAIFFDVLSKSIFFSNGISVGSAAAFSFCMNSFYNFKKSNYLLLRFFSFILVVMVGYFAGVSFILFFVNVVGIAAIISKILSLPLVFLLQYFLNSTISFR